MITDDYPLYVTVLRRKDKFYCAVMAWDCRGERYVRSPDHMLGKLKTLRTDALIEAEALAQRLELEVRL